MRFSLPSLLVVSLLVAHRRPRAGALIRPAIGKERSRSPMAEMLFHVDLSKNAKGDVIGTYSRPDEQPRGSSVDAVTLDGRAIGFVLTGNTMFQGVLFADGKTISGDVTAPIGTAPFTMTRTGEAVFAPTPKNSPIARELEGTWNGTLSLQGESLRLILRIANQADGTATGTIISVDRGDLELTLGMTQKASVLTLNSPVDRRRLLHRCAERSRRAGRNVHSGPGDCSAHVRSRRSHWREGVNDSRRWPSHSRLGLLRPALGNGLGATESLEQQRPRAAPVQLAVELRWPVVREVLVALLVRAVVHRSAGAENRVSELVRRDPADAPSDAVDECLPERPRRRMGDRRHHDFGEVHGAAPAQQTHRNVSPAFGSFCPRRRSKDSRHANGPERRAGCR